MLVAHWLVGKGMRCTLSSCAVPLLQTANQCVTLVLQRIMQVQSWSRTVSQQRGGQGEGLGVSCM